MGFIYLRKHFRKDREVLQGRTYWICYSRNGRRIRESSRSTKVSAARRLLRLREGQVAAGIPISQKTATVRTNELIDDLIDDYALNDRRSVMDLKRRSRNHVLPFFGGRRAETITTSDVRRYALLKQEQGYSNAEINRQLAIVRRMLRLAVQNGKAVRVPYVPMLKESSPRSGFFERQQFETVRVHLAEPLQPLVTFAYLTGWRKQEVLDLQWRNVDLRAGRVVLDPGSTKNDAARTFPLTQQLRLLLEAQRVSTDMLQRERGTVIPWVFHRDGRKIRVFRKAFQTACKRAGVPGRIFHDFRRTAVRNLVRAGIPERVAMQMTGHKTRSVFERYNIVSEGDLDMAAMRLDEAARKAEPATADTVKAG